MAKRSREACYQPLLSVREEREVVADMAKRITGVRPSPGATVREPMDGQPFGSGAGESLREGLGLPLRDRVTAPRLGKREGVNPGLAVVVPIPLLGATGDGLMGAPPSRTPLHDRGVNEAESVAAVVWRNGDRVRVPVISRAGAWAGRSRLHTSTDLDVILIARSSLEARASGGEDREAISGGWEDATGPIQPGEGEATPTLLRRLGSRAGLGLPAPPPFIRGAGASEDGIQTSHHRPVG